MAKKKTKKKVIKRGVSKIVTPVDNSGYNDRIQAFKCNEEVDDYLKGLENKSEFIREALLEAIGKNVEVTCPTCKGRGRIRPIRKRKMA